MIEYCLSKLKNRFDRELAPHPFAKLGGCTPPALKVLTFNRGNTGHWRTRRFQTTFDIDRNAWRMRRRHLSLLGQAERLQGTGAVSFAIW